MSPSTTMPVLMSLTTEERQWCIEGEVATYLPLAESLVRRYFPSAGSLRWGFDTDPETGDRATVLAFDSHISLAESIQRLGDLSAEWSERVPWPQSDGVIFDFEAAD